MGSGMGRLSERAVSIHSAMTVVELLVFSFQFSVFSFQFSVERNIGEEHVLFLAPVDDEFVAHVSRSRVGI